jgi:GNAT superfamily N-acetyltransferase
VFIGGYYIIERPHDPAYHGFSFAAWREGGWWTGDYTVYGLFEDGRLNACAGAYQLDLLVRGRLQQVVQIGSVATRSDCRGRGLSRRVLEHLLAQQPTTPHMLCANPSVLDFYPRFGFREVQVKTASITGPFPRRREERSTAGVSSFLIPEPCDGREAREAGVLAYLHRRGAFSQVLDCTNAAPINAFHLLLEPSLRRYKIEELQALLVVERHGDTLNLVDVIAAQPCLFARLAPYLALDGVRTIRFGFNPDWLGLEVDWAPPAEDPHLFVRGAWDVPEPFTLPYLLMT